MRKLFLFVIAIATLTSCAQMEDECPVINNHVSYVAKNKQQMFSEFAEALSAVLYENTEARQALKEEIVKQFDKNYEVLWDVLKDKKVGDTSFRSLLVSKSSADFVSNLEENFPLLNVLMPEIPMFKISPEAYNVNDNELPVVLPGEKYNKFFFNGNLEDSIEVGEVPGFNVVVVNENSRVTVESATRAGGRMYSFKSPNYDGTRATRAEVTTTSVSQKERDAYNYFHSLGNGNDQMAYQRDYLYYGMTPLSEKGNFNYNTSEYISCIRVNPNTYFTMTDKLSSTLEIDPSDPYIKEETVTKYKGVLTEEELIDRMWTKGAYNFRFEIYTSNKENPTICYIPLKPSEIWDCHIELVSYRHSTAFRHSRYIYKIDPNKFTSKVVNLDDNLVDFGKWDLSTEAASRYIKIYEEDPERTIEETVTHEFSVVEAGKINGSIKIGLDLFKSFEGNAGGEHATTTTNKTTKTFTVKRTIESDKLGAVTVYFNDPLIKEISGNNIVRNTYNTGSIEFCITVK